MLYRNPVSKLSESRIYSYSYCHPYPIEVNSQFFWFLIQLRSLKVFRSIKVGYNGILIFDGNSEIGAQEPAR